MTADVDLSDGAAYFVPEVRFPGPHQVEVDLRQGHRGGMHICMVMPVRVRVPAVPAAVGRCRVVVSWSRRSKAFEVTVPPVAPGEKPITPFVATTANISRYLAPDGTVKEHLDDEQPLDL